jgi:hypothetical protein
MKNQDVKLEDLGKILKEEEPAKKNTDETENSDDGEKDSTEGEKNKKEKDKEPEENDDADLEMNEDTPEFIESMGTISYITFDEFAKNMSLFNPRTGIEEKIQCK